MSNYCTDCGALLHENDKFCNGCGKPLNNSEPTSPPAPAPAPAPAPMSTTPNPELEKPIGIWAYVGCMLLWCIPIVGLISGIVMAVACQKKSMRNFALAVLIVKVAAVIASLLLGIVVGLVSMEIIETIVNAGYAALFSIFA